MSKAERTVAGGPRPCISGSTFSTVLCLRETFLDNCLTDFLEQFLSSFPVQSINTCFFLKVY